MSLPILRSVTLALAIGAAGAGCAARAPQASPPRSRAALAALGADLSSLFGAPEHDRTLWGVHVQAVETGEALFERNAATLMMPASTMKILTLAASAERLGWDFTFETRLVTAASVEAGVLKGDLIAVGSGDPSLGGRVGDNGRAFASFADALWDAGIRTIDGRLIGDDRAFDDDGVGAGWSWDDLAYGYAAPVGALAYDENAVELIVRAGPSQGAAAEVTIPLASVTGLIVDNQVVTSATGEAPALDLRRAPGTTRLLVRGTVPAGAPALVRTVSVDNPTNFFIRTLLQALMARGIAVTGVAIDIGSVSPPPPLDSARVLVTHRSAPLSDLAGPLMKVSRNVYGEALLKTLGRTTGQAGSVRTGRQAVQDVLAGWGISPDRFILSDGSGLSRYNYVTADALVTVLRRLAGDPRHATAFEATLPIAGRDGTLRTRLAGTPAENNVRAKTGSISNVRAISGYLRTRDGEGLAFAIVANNFSAPAERVDETIDRTLERLAAFSRRER